MGHSAGGHTLSACAVRSGNKNLFRSLILLDPVMFSQPSYDKSGASVKSTFFKDAWVLKRRNAFQSVEEFSERMADRMPYKQWHPRVRADYFRHAIHQPKPDAPYELLCSPQSEFLSYAGSFSDPVAELNERLVNIPVRVMRSTFGLFDSQVFQGERDVFQTSPTDAELWRRFPRAVDEVVDGMGHFFPMEKPECVLRRLLAFAGPPLRVPGKPKGPPAPKPPRRARL